MLEALQAAGYTTTQDAKGRYLAGMVRVLDSQLAWLKQAYMVRLLRNAQLRKGRAYTFKQMEQIALPQEQQIDFQATMQFLVERRVFWRGCRLMCPFCALDMWYALDAIHEGLHCQGCDEPLSLPLDHPFAYRLNPLFMEGLTSGALTILLALHYFQQRQTITEWQAGILVSGNGQTQDIDLLLRGDDGLILLECKDHYKQLTAIEPQLAQAATLAEAINARFVFATLQATGTDYDVLGPSDLLE